MIQIVSIETKMRRKEWRVILTLSDGETLEVDADTFAQFDLHSGDTLDEAVRDRLLRADLKQRAVQQALRWLAVRPQAAGELHRRLSQKGYGKVAGDVVEKLKEQQYLHDEDFARRYARTRLLSKSIGPRAMEQELKAKGVADSVIREVLAELMTDETVMQLAEKAVARKTGALKKLDPVKRRQTLFTFLLQRGFEPDTIHRVLARLVQ